MKATLVLLASAAMVVTLASCTKTIGSRSVEPSGFLGDYSTLTEGDGDQAKLRYVSSDADWSSYRSIIVEPVTVWTEPGSKLEGVSSEDLQALADYLQSKTVETLGPNWTIAGQPGEGTLTLRVAITEASQSKVALDIVSTVMPIGLALNGLKTLATGTPSFVGKAGVEMEITDSMSGKRLAAAVDRRVGGKTVSGSTGSWNDVKAAFDLWADRLATRLQEMRQ